jgi:methyl-accepting chemotaxis protein
MEESMTLLFRPAVALMQRLRLLPKFVLVCLVFLVPLVLVSGLLLAELQKSIAASEAERAGAAYIVQVHGIARLVQQHRGAEHLRLSTRASAADAALRAAIGKRIAALDAHQAGAGALAGLSAWRAAREGWVALDRAQPSASAKPCRAAGRAAQAGGRGG